MSNSNEYRRIAASMAERYGVDPELFVRLVERESGFDPNARGADGEIGLTQIMSDTGQEPGYGVKPIEDRFDPVDNLRFGAEYLGKMIQHYEGDVSKALMAFNGGGGNVDKGTVSGDAEKYASELLGGKEIKSGSPVPNSPMASMTQAEFNALRKGIAGLGPQGKLPRPLPAAPIRRVAGGGKMSPLRKLGIPGLGIPGQNRIGQLSAPGGVESLYRK